jgi:dTDP-4-dehydrorhamnose reductase
LKLLFLGYIVQLGWELNPCLQPLGNVVALDYPEIDMAKTGTIQKTLREHHPDLTINAMAYSTVEKTESESELAEAINSAGQGLLAEMARKLNPVLVHFSTYFVFDGKKGTPHVEIDLPHHL